MLTLFRHFWKGVECYGGPPFVQAGQRNIPNLNQQEVFTIQNCHPVSKLQTNAFQTAFQLRRDLVDSGGMDQLVNETQCITNSGEMEWAAGVCHNGGGKPYTETEAVHD